MNIKTFEVVGAEVTNINLKNVDTSLAQDCKELLSEQGMLVIRKQYINDEEFVAFLKSLGTMTFTTGEHEVERYPELNKVSNIGRTTPPKSNFHSDSTYFEKPPAYTSLRPVVLPQSGGATWFTNQYRSYETLSDTLKSKLEDKKMKHVVTRVNLNDKENAETAAQHPVFFKHPISGRTSLYMSTLKRCQGINGYSDEEASVLIKKCYLHSIQEKNIYKHHWQQGDIVIWDNMCTLHRADHSAVVGDRVLHRGLSLGFNA